MPYCFESDPDEFPFGDRVYTDFFNLYPELNFDATCEHLKRLNTMVVLRTEKAAEGWRIEVQFDGVLFLLDTHFHGTSTLFCVEKGTTDESSMLAFLGCFMPVVRDHWRV